MNHENRIVVVGPASAPSISAYIRSIGTEPGFMVFDEWPIPEPPGDDVSPLNRHERRRAASIARKRLAR